MHLLVVASFSCSCETSVLLESWYSSVEEESFFYVLVVTLRAIVNNVKFCTCLVVRLQLYATPVFAVIYADGDSSKAECQGPYGPVLK